jgi:uncharacterized protein YjbI with pentapeptide repeats
MGWLSYAPSAVRNPAETVEARLARTMAHAEAFVAAMASVKGPTVRIWTRPGTAEVRIYFPMKFGYLSVGQDGTLSEMSRGQQTLEVSGMWPAWQALYRKAKKIYLEGLDRRIAAEWAAHEAEVAEEEALLRQREQEKEEQALYEQMLEKAYWNPRPARRNESALQGDMTAAGLLTKAEPGTSLANADLRNYGFNDLYLTKMDLSGVDFRNASFTNTIFAECNLEGANFEGARFENVAFKRQCRLGRVNFTKARIEGTHFRNSFMEGAIFDNAEAQSVLFWLVSWTKGSAKGANFYNMRARGCDFRGTDFTGAYLADSQFADVDVSPDMFVGADLTGSDLKIERSSSVLPIQGRSSAFDKWFGKSKIVNEDGTPRVLYHGTDKAGFTAFSKDKIDAWHPGFFLADKPELAQTYSGSPQLDPFATGHNKGLYRVYVRMAKPYIHDAKGSDWKSIPWGKDGIDFINTDGIGAWAKAKKYDGVIIRNVVDIGQYGGFTKPANVYIVFDPTNIKSAAYNQGTWDRKDPDIRHNPNGQPRAPRAPRRARRNESTYTYPWDASTKVQSLQFDKDLFTADEAKAWARQHGFRYGNVDLGQGNWLRLRQADPEHFRPSTFRVISFRDGVQAVIAVPKRSHR